MRRVRKQLRNRTVPVIFLQDNARPHTANVTKQLLEQFDWEVLEHPPYSPDMAPSDYHLFRSLEHFLRHKKFQNVNEMSVALSDFFHSKPCEFYRRGIFMLPDKWLDVMDSKGDYFDY